MNERQRDGSGFRNRQYDVTADRSTSHQNGRAMSGRRASEGSSRGEKKVKGGRGAGAVKIPLNSTHNGPFFFLFE